MLTIAVIGLGSRGLHYARLSRQRGGVAFHALCDVNPQKIKNAVSVLEADSARTFENEEEFFAAGKLADVLYICTQDRDHFRQAMKGLELGYDILMEKPVSPNPKDCVEIARKAEETGRRVFVCHVLRYSAFYRRIKEVLSQNLLGDIILVEHNEHIGYWHFAHSYVRGNWHKEEETTPMLMAKCCHDMDLLYWWLGSCDNVSSHGGLTWFRPENAPQGAARRCKDCALSGSCLYDSLSQYLSCDGKEPRFPWGAYALTASREPEDIKEAALEGPYGRCVFHADNDVCDHQTAHLLFKHDGKDVPVLFSVSAFSNECYRNTHIFGTKGELWGDDESETLTLHLFGKEPEKLTLSLADTKSYGGGHVGGDSGLIEDVLDYLEGKDVPMQRLTPIRETIESHLIVAACEESRKSGGAQIRVHKD